MATIHPILGILCVAIAMQPIKLSGNILENNRHLLDPTNLAQQQIITTAKNELGVKEKSGKNDGKEVEAYLAYVGLKKGNPWCAAFVSWVFGKNGHTVPRTAWSTALFPKNRSVNTVEPAHVFGIYFPKLKRIAHVGLVEKVEGSWIITIEGNTNLTGSREGDGVYRKLRLKKSIKAFSNWLPKERGGLP